MFRARPVLLLMSVLVGACASHSRVAGEYRLVALNGMSLPARVQGDTCQPRVQAGSLTLGSDARWRGVLIGQDPCRASIDTSWYAGRYSTDGSALSLQVDSFTWGGRPSISGEASDTLLGTASGSTLTVRYSGKDLAGGPQVFSLRRVP